MIGSVTEVQAEQRVAEKRRKAARQRPAEPEATTAATDAHAAAEGFQSAIDAADHAAKTFRERGATLGPDTGRAPGHPEPSDFDRAYLDAGHASRSPMAMPPRSSPLPTGPHGITPVQLAADVTATAIPAHIAAQFTMGSPSNR